MNHGYVPRAAEAARLFNPRSGRLSGAPALDFAAIARVIAQVGALMRARMEITEIDINPLMAYPSGVVALDVLLATE